MRGKVGLLEYLATPVHVPSRDDGTSHTAVDNETYDDDPGLSLLEYGYTVDTKRDTETYDDDPGLGSLDHLGTETTIHTRVDSETYDEDDALSLIARLDLEGGSVHTFVRNETYDDDPGLGSLAHWDETSGLTEVSRNSSCDRNGDHARLWNDH